MEIHFTNYWSWGNSMKISGSFPLHFLDIRADIHPAERFLGITIFNFEISVGFPSEKKWWGEK